MKCLIRLVISIVLCVALVPAAQATIVGTVHDLSASGSLEYASDETQVCIFCHTPHGGRNIGPLWNRNFGTAAAFTMYTSDTASATVTAAAATQSVNAESMLCLACHDGSVSVYEMINYSTIGQPIGPGGSSDVTIQFAANPAGYNANIGSGSFNAFGGQLNDDHPISFSYNTVLTDYAAPPVKTGLKAVGSVPTAIRFFGTTNRVECSSCHDPHDATELSFLVMSNSGSNLCLGCHVK